MDELVVSTVVCLPPDEVYDFLTEFPRYADYSEHLREVHAHGDGSPGTRYDLEFAWWKLTYTARSEVTATSPPTRIDWRLVDGLDAGGRWRIDPLDDVPPEVPDDAGAASRVFLEVEYDPDSVGTGTVDLPRFVSLDRVVSKVRPLVRSEAERVVSRVVTDLEGRSRDVALRIHRTPD
ncbi:type II toxin-antitoxin system RatA family toxin [Haloplanus sp. GCM10025708]|uniref:type II toxin-antitoxin system RatA family toxin n=1 Tax=Haloferacaceae TaxID=1644056 RepID=UPI00360889FA